MKSSIDIFNWTDNYLEDIKSDIYNLKNSKHQVSLRKRNQSQVFNLTEPDKKIKKPNHNFTKSDIFNKDQTAIDHLDVGKKVLKKHNNNSNDIKDIITRPKVNNSLGIVNYNKRVPIGNISSVDNPLNNSASFTIKKQLKHNKSVSINLF